MSKLFTDNMVFVFGSNEGGIHGAGAAKYAHTYKSAVFGCGFGHSRFGDTQSFAIPTKNADVSRTLSIPAIAVYINAFMAYARARSDLRFQVTCIGCGLAGLDHEDIAPLFRQAPDNCYFDTLWREHLPDLPAERFWGTF